MMSGSPRRCASTLSSGRTGGSASAHPAAVRRMRLVFLFQEVGPDLGIKLGDLRLAELEEVALVGELGGDFHFRRTLHLGRQILLRTLDAIRIFGKGRDQSGV